VERCRLLLHLVDVSDLSDRDPVHDFEVILKELHRFSNELAEKPMFVVASKMDSCQDPLRVESLKTKALERALPFFEISSVTGQGLDELRFAVADRLFVSVEPAA